MDLLKVSGINKTNKRGFHLKDISFTQGSLAHIGVAGETGSGKTTLFKIIAGLIQPDSGELLFKGEKVIGPDYKLIPGHKGIAYLSQQFELPNFLRVEQVLEYANELHEKEAEELYHICRLEHLMKRRTDQLSGGERQRIAIARLLINSPELFLLDEPFSNMDMLNKNLLKSVLNDISARLKITFMIISHDPLDMLSWAHDIFVMKDGVILQKAKPEMIYSNPQNEYIAGLFGKYNMLNGELLSLFSVSMPESPAKKAMIRPENLSINGSFDADPSAKIINTRYYGSYYELDIIMASQLLVLKCNDLPGREGDTVKITLDPRSIVYLSE
jgi:iron(III) transport system ATP-binding protein